MLNVLDKSRKHYEFVAEVLAPFVNSVSPMFPRARKKLHIGLFGYSRSVAGVSLPRAIPFAASLYSIGFRRVHRATVLEELTDAEYKALSKNYVNLKHDFCSVGGYVSWENINMLMEMHPKVAKRADMNVDSLRLALTRILADLKAVEEKVDTKLGPRTLEHRKHENLTNNFLITTSKAKTQRHAKRWWKRLSCEDA